MAPDQRAAFGTQSGSPVLPFLHTDDFACAQAGKTTVGSVFDATPATTPPGQPLGTDPARLTPAFPFILAQILPAERPRLHPAPPLRPLTPPAPAPIVAP